MELMVIRKNTDSPTTTIFGPSPKGSENISITMGKMAILGST